MKQELKSTELVVNSAIDRDGVFKWREKKRQKIIERLEKKLEKKANEIDEQISTKFLELNTFDKFLVAVGFQEAATEFHDNNVAPAINEWLNKTYKDLCQDIPEKPNSESINNSHGPKKFTQNWNAIFQTGSGTLLGIGALSALPVGVSAAVTTTTTLFFFTSTVISLPILLAAIGGAAVAGGLGGREVKKGIEELTTEYRKQVVGALREKVLGKDYLYMKPFEENNPEIPESQMSLAQVLLLEVDHMASLKLEKIPWPHP